MRILSRLNLVLVLSLVLISHPGNAESLSPEEILFVPWGDGSGAVVGYRTDPDGRFGPQSFRSGEDGTTVQILDSLGRALKTFRGNRIENVVPAPEGSRDFLVRPAGDRLFLAGNEIQLYRGGALAARYNEGVELPRIRRIDQAESVFVLTNHDGSRSSLNTDLTPDKGRVSSGVTVFEAVRHSPSRAEILRSSQDGGMAGSISLDIPTGDLGGLRVVGSDDLGRIFVDVFLIERPVPLQVRREVWILAESGAVLGRIPIPTHYFTRSFRDLELMANGDLHHMVSAEDGIHIFRWKVRDISGGGYLGEYPDRFRTRVHYNFDVRDESPATGSAPSYMDKSTASTVTRGESVSTGDTYVQHLWTASAANLSDGAVTAPDGDLVETPDWIVVGLNQRIPYKWGGFDTLASFDSGIAGGMYAGDIHIAGPSSYARGVDCSGYVSRCWNLNQQYTTRMMDDPAYGPITQPYLSWDDIQPGDTIHKHGHMRLTVTGLLDGSFLVLESAGTATNHGVGYSDYVLADLEGYSPRYYIGMEGAPPASTIVSAVSGSWTAGSTWVGGVAPGSMDDVLIASGHTISVDDLNAECRSIAFGADDALIDINANTLLTVYGDFTIFSDAHVAFSAGWSATNAYIKFAGSATQTLRGWDTAGGSTSFRDVIVDKDGGKLTTEGNGMRLGIQNSLEIVNGLFELSPDDDLEGRWASSGNYRNAALPDITIQSGGELYLADGSGVHHMRSSATPTAIGMVTLYGKATFRDASTNKISLTGINVENGGKLITSLGMGTAKFDCGPIVVKDGGELENYTTSDIWGGSASLTVNAGGTYDTKSSVTVFPSSFTDNGKVRYSRDSTTDQTIVDRDYNNLEISQDTDHVKVWNLTGARTVQDTLNVNSSGSLVINAATAQTLTVNGLLFLTSGSLDNSDPEVALTMADGTMIQRATGVITSAPTFAGMVDLRYTSTSSQVSAGPEVPTAIGVLNDYRLSGSEGVLMTSNMTVNGTISIENSDLITGAFGVTLAPGATLVESAGATVLGNAMTTRTAAQSVNETFGGLGLEILAAGAAPGATTVTRVTGSAQTVEGSPGILRSFQVSPANNTGLDATVVFHYDDSELNGITENSLAMFEDNGGGWAQLTSALDEVANTLTVSGRPIVTDLTAAPGDVSGVAGDVLPVRTEIVSIHPNPFNPLTKVKLSLEKAGPVQVAIYDVRGQKVRTLRTGTLERGTHELTWHGVDDAGRAVSSGVYFCRLSADGQIRTEKMMLAK